VKKILANTYAAIDEMFSIDAHLAADALNYMENNIGSKEMLLKCAWKMVFQKNVNTEMVLALVETYEYESVAQKNIDIAGVAIVRAMISTEITHTIEEKCVYIVELSNGTVKIGVSANLGRRLKEIKNQSGANIIRFCYSNNTKNAFVIEAKMHEEFSEYRLNGEFFYADYQDCKRRLEAFKDIAYLEVAS